MPAGPEEHDRNSLVLLQNAQDELYAGDVLQASEKAWGAVAHYVKGVADERKWRTQGHDDVVRIAKALTARCTAPTRQRDRLMFYALGLHRNFYEDDLDPDAVQRGINEVTKLLAALRTAESRFPKKEPTRRTILRTLYRNRDSGSGNGMRPR